jgi:hypothetical protein
MAKQKLVTAIVSQWARTRKGKGKHIVAGNKARERKRQIGEGKQVKMGDQTQVEIAVRSECALQSAIEKQKTAVGDPAAARTKSRGRIHRPGHDHLLHHHLPNLRLANMVKSAPPREADPQRRCPTSPKQCESPLHLVLKTQTEIEIPPIETQRKAKAKTKTKKTPRLKRRRS